jgi:hypothetical protein
MNHYKWKCEHDISNADSCNRCKICRHLQYRILHPIIKVRRNGPQFCINHPDKKAKAKGLCNACYYKGKVTPETRRRASLKHLYNLTEEQYQILLNKQNGVCAICHKPETRINWLGKPIHLEVDHIHGTKEIRGLLCHKCNTGIGLLGEEVEQYKAATEYLEKYKTTITLSPDILSDNSPISQSTSCPLNCSDSNTTEVEYVSDIAFDDIFTSNAE